MKYSLVTLISFLLVLPFCSVAQKYQSALWEISGNGLKQKSYLFGTIHVVPYKTIDKFPELEQIIRKCEAGIFEITDTDPRTTDPILKAKTSPPLDSIFSAREYAVADSFFVKAGYGSMREHNYDGSVSGMIQVALMVKGFPGASTEMGIDDIIHKMMIDDKKPRFQLDDPNVRARNELVNSSPKEGVKLLMAIIENSSNSEELNMILSVTDSLIDIKKYMDGFTYDMMLSKAVPSNSIITTKMKQATERNLLWMPVINTCISEQSCFIAVGIWHLRYTSGLISLLGKQGYTLKPVVLKKGG